MSNGAHVDEYNSTGTALHTAALNGYLDIVDLLLSYGASYDWSDGTQNLVNPMYYAITNKHPCCIARLSIWPLLMAIIVLQELGCYNLIGPASFSDLLAFMGEDRVAIKAFKFSQYYDEGAENACMRHFSQMYSPTLSIFWTTSYVIYSLDFYDVKETTHPEGESSVQTIPRDISAATPMPMAHNTRDVSYTTCDGKHNVKDAWYRDGKCTRVMRPAPDSRTRKNLKAEPRQINCSYCNEILNSVKFFKSHLNSEKHLRNVRSVMGGASSVLSTAATATATATATAAVRERVIEASSSLSSSSSSLSPFVFECCGRNFKTKNGMMQHRKDSSSCRHDEEEGKRRFDDME